MLAIFDTETSGLIRRDLPPDDPSQPHICQIGIKRFDGAGRQVGSFTALIQPDGWSMEAEAQSVHGIREIDCVRHGLPLPRALAAFAAHVEASMIVAAHNLAFDRQMVDVALKRVGAKGGWWLAKKDGFRCTMERSVGLCQLPGEFGFKYPTLEEAHAILVPTVPYASAHNVDDDIAAAHRVYRAIDALGGFDDA